MLMPGRRRTRRSAPTAPTRPRLAHFRSDGTAKTRFASRDEADRAAFQARLDHGRELSSYQCQMCGGWHLGSRQDELW
ncbi:MAG TPA: hypothetical protein VK428_02340 [Acidimicrobiales bacterium]|nr:hypothetical protein [Acidimicrobiales bacterium]